MKCLFEEGLRKQLKMQIGLKLAYSIVHTAMLQLSILFFTDALM